MGKARNLARLIVDSSGDVDSSSLSNVPPSDDASALTTGTLSAARIADGSLGVAKLTASGTAGSSTFLRGDGAWQTPGGGFSNMQVFTSSGTFTVPAGVTKVKVTVQGGGGGSPWAAGYSSGNGNAGGTSSFGAYISATGGSGTATGSPQYTNGGTASGGSFTVNGFIGESYGYPHGANSINGFGAYPITWRNSNNQPVQYSRRGALGYGSGGSDIYGSRPGGGGGAFSQGVFTVTPGAAITVTVGAAGTSGGNGGSGTQGFVIVEY